MGLFKAPRPAHPNPRMLRACCAHTVWGNLHHDAYDTFRQHYAVEETSGKKVAAIVKIVVEVVVLVAVVVGSSIGSSSSSSDSSSTSTSSM